MTVMAPSATHWQHIGKGSGCLPPGKLVCAMPLYFSRNAFFSEKYYQEIILYFSYLCIDLTMFIGATFGEKLLSHH